MHNLPRPPRKDPESASLDAVGAGLVGGSGEEVFATVAVGIPARGENGAVMGPRGCSVENGDELQRRGRENIDPTRIAEHARIVIRSSHEPVAGLAGARVADRAEVIAESIAFVLPPGLAEQVTVEVDQRHPSSVRRRPVGQGGADEDLGQVIAGHVAGAGQGETEGLTGARPRAARAPARSTTARTVRVRPE